MTCSLLSAIELYYSSLICGLFNTLFFEKKLYDHQFLVSHPHLLEEGPINAKPAPVDFEAPEACENQDGDEAKGSLEGSDSTLSPPSAESEDQGPEKKQNRKKDLTSLGTSNPKDVPQEPMTSKDSNLGIFRLLDS
jgi:hypothetical protein